MAEGSEQLRRVALAILKDLSKIAGRHGPKLRKAAGEVIEKDLPRAVSAVRRELPDVERQLHKEWRNLRRK